MHQTPGRLRVRSPALVKRPDATRHILVELRKLPGVLGMAVNPVIGSMTIRYDARTLAAATLINRLTRLGVLDRVIGFPLPLRPARVRARAPAAASRYAAPRAASLPAGDAHKLLAVAAKLLLPLIVERAFGRTGRAVVAALL